MSFHKISALAATCLSAVCLSSCYVYWNTGKCVRESAVTYTGVNTSRPVGDVVYKAKDCSFYMQAPEVTYQLKHEVCGIRVHKRFGSSPDPDKTYVEGSTDTGALRWVKVDSPPAGANVVPLGGKTIPASEIADAEEVEQERSGWSWAATAVSYPLQYVVDPLLTITTTAALYVVSTPPFIIIAPYAATQTSRIQQTTQQP